MFLQDEPENNGQTDILLFDDDDDDTGGIVD
jgi:hypothetical protein